jgi:hypothetical protein
MALMTWGGSKACYAARKMLLLRFQVLHEYESVMARRV